MAVYRPFLEIFHHYIVKEIYIYMDYMVIIHNAGDLSSFLSSIWFAEIKEETIKFVTKHANENMSVY